MKNNQNREWTEILEQFRASGQSAKKFADEKQISVHTLRHQIRKEKIAASGKEKSPGFVQVPVKPPEVGLLPEIILTVEGRSTIIQINFSA